MTYDKIIIHCKICKPNIENWVIVVAYVQFKLVFKGLVDNSLPEKGYTFCMSQLVHFDSINLEIDLSLENLLLKYHIVWNTSWKFHKMSITVTDFKTILEVWWWPQEKSLDFENDINIILS
jgi:hypothetical protein